MKSVEQGAVLDTLSAAMKAAFSSLLTILVSGALWAAPRHAATLPNPAEGVINGKIAVALVPALMTPDGELMEHLLPNEGCTITLVPEEHKDEERQYPCGEWFLPEVGKYKLWLESGDLISPFPSVLSFGGAKFEGRGMRGVYPLGPAGTITYKATREGQLRVVHLDSHRLSTGVIRHAFERRLNGRFQGMVPAGRVLAALFDRETNDAIAVARPISVAQGARVAVAPTPPASGSDVLAIIGRPRLANDTNQDRVTLQLSIDDQSARTPDVFIDSANRLYAVWYGVVGSKATLTATSETLSLQPIAMVLRDRSVITRRAKLAVRPNLDVHIVAPNELGTTAMALELEDVDGTILTRTNLGVARDHVFQAVPPNKLRVGLEFERYRVSQRVDLGDGADQRLVIDLQPLIVTGTVSFRDHTVPAATVSFKTSDEWTSVTADESGRYSITLWEPGYYIVGVTMADLPAMHDFIRIVDSRTVDLALPNAIVTVHVVDDRGSPLVGAAVKFENVWDDEKHRPRNMVEQVVSDTRGNATLPPMRAGTLSITATARGYDDATLGPLALADDDLSLEVSLQTRSEQTLRVMLESGPATGAEAILTATLTDVIWRGTANEKGDFEVPNHSGYLLIRHPNASSAITPWPTEADTLALTPASPPLRLQVTSTRTGPIQVALLIQGQVVYGPALAFLTWSSVAANRDGTFIATNLPRANTFALAWQQTPPGGISDRFALLASPVAYPWTVAVPIKTTD